MKKTERVKIWIERKEPIRGRKGVFHVSYDQKFVVRKFGEYLPIEKMVPVNGFCSYYYPKEWRSDRGTYRQDSGLLFEEGKKIHVMFPNKMRKELKVVTKKIQVHGGYYNPILTMTIFGVNEKINGLTVFIEIEKLKVKYGETSRVSEVK